MESTRLAKEKQEILEREGYRYSFDQQIYFNRANAQPSCRRSLCEKSTSIFFPIFAAVQSIWKLRSNITYYQ
jgi:hypothetical protein